MQHRLTSGLHVTLTSQYQIEPEVAKSCLMLSLVSHGYALFSQLYLVDKQAFSQ